VDLPQLAGAGGALPRDDGGGSTGGRACCLTADPVGLGGGGAQ
jgi:hypothetical protein